jgi:voltage-gated potassium channel Kch
VFARAFDRWHEVALINVGADFHLRETFESAPRLGARTLETLGASAEDIATIEAQVRKRDAQRLRARTRRWSVRRRRVLHEPAPQEEPQGSGSEQ